VARRRLTVCATPGCPHLTEPGSSYCAECQRQRRAASDARRPSATQRGYDARWARTRARYLASHPTCECDDCLALPMHERPRATDVDHRDGLGPLGPRGHDWSNLRAMSHEHHSRRTARDQRAGWNA
jgi:5-methylcytosine-specific restriction protein A